MKPQRYAKKEWGTNYIEKALRLSSGPWLEDRARFTTVSTRKLFLIGNSFRKHGGTILVESDDTGEKWGENEFMVHLSDEAHEYRLWFEQAASFGGSLYLVHLRLMQFFALERAGSSLHTLFLLSGRLQDPVDTSYLLNTLLQFGPHVKNVAMYGFRLSFSYLSSLDSLHGLFRDKLPIPLHTLHLESIKGSWFVEMLESLFCVSHTLSLVGIGSGIVFPVSDYFDIDHTMESLIGSPDRPKFLEWKLTQLNLDYCFEERIELTSFVKALGNCPLKTLRSLSLRGSGHTPYNRKDKARFVGVVIDALHKSGLQFLDLGGFEQEPGIQAQLLRNRRSTTHHLLPYSKVPAVAMRLFTCGDSLAGKTTLLSTLSNEGSYLHVLDKLKAKVMSQISPLNTSKRTRGIEIHTIVKHKIRLSLWDMAGETEFHAFHDHMFPDPSSSHGSPSMFMFVWSPMHSKNAKKGKLKTPPEFESSFGYWLRFINSKTRQSNTKRKVIVVFTRGDQTKLVRNAMKSSIDALKTAFSNTIEIVDVLEVDARSKASVNPLHSSIFQAAQDVLTGVEVYSICSQVSEHLLRRHNLEASVGSAQPVISWDKFSELCRTQFNVTELEVQKAIAYSLNESGDIIHLRNLDYLVLDPNWFCNEVMGNLIHFSRPGTSRVILPIDGYVEQDYLETLLQESSRSTVDGSVLLALMEAMHLCCRVPEDPRRMIFIPALLPESRTSGHLQWRGAVSGRSTTQVYVGRRLACDKKDSTFLTQGLFPTIQVLFKRAFYEKEYDKKLGKPDVQEGKWFMSVCMQENEILVEWGRANGEYVIDVMMRAPDDEDAGYTLAYMEEKVIKTVIAVCAQPVGNQGVRLVEAVIRPDCLHSPSSLHERPCALILDLKQELKEQLEGGRRHEKLVHLWRGNSDLQLHSVTSHFMDLLGPEEFMQVLKSYKASLEEVFLMQDPIATASTSSHIARELEVVPISTDSQDGAEHSQGMREGITEETSEVKVDEHEQVVDALIKSMVNDVSNTVLYRKLQSMDGKLVGVQQSVQSIGTKVDGVYKSIEDLRCRALPKVQSLVEQSLNFALQNEAGKVPRFVFLTTDDKPGFRRKMVTTIVRGLKTVRIELFCEHRDRPHHVDGQARFCVSTVDDGSMINQALPYVNGFLKVLTLAAKVGAHVLAGAGSTIPDFSKLVALAADTPGFLDNKGFSAKASTSPEKDFNGWQQWLVSVLEKNGGMTESNIASKFMLRRARYKDTSKVAWLCGMHYKDQCPLPLV